MIPLVTASEVGRAQTLIVCVDCVKSMEDVYEL